jgi:hypothetical protein
MKALSASEISQRRSERRAFQPPPIPSITMPVPPQFWQGKLDTSPVPWHSGQIFSPAPGVPGLASSPGSSFGSVPAVVPPLRDPLLMESSAFDL